MVAGSVQNKEVFLNKISAKLGQAKRGEVELPKWQHQPQLEVYKSEPSEVLANAFRNSSAEKSTYVVNTDSVNLAAAVKEVIEKYGGGQIVASKDRRFQEFGLSEILADSKTH